jgi:hypothetical protein
VVDEHRMADCRLCCPEWCLFQNSRVQRSPARILTVGDDAITGSRYPPVSFVDGKNLARWLPESHIVVGKPAYSACIH